jgi:succinoglycan biosynthesis protein ExoA
VVEGGVNQESVFTFRGDRPPAKRKQPIACNMDVPFVTVIVPVRNEEAFLEATLRPLLDQHYPSHRFEVIVADGRSDDRTADVVRRLQNDHPNLHLVDNPRRLSSAGRNLGVKRGRGDYFLIVDGHCEVRNQDYLRQLVDVFERTGVESVGRPQPLDVTGASPLQKAIALARSSRLGHNPGSFIYSDQGQFVPPQSVAVAYRRDVFERIGYFDESFDACEDVEFNTRLAASGGRCYLAPELTVHYHPRATLTGLARQMSRYGRGRARLLRKHPETFSVPPLVPAAFLLSLVCSVLLGLVQPIALLAFAAIVVMYAAAIAVGSMAVAVRQRAPASMPLLPGVFAAIHFGAGWGVLAELARSIMVSPRRESQAVNALSFDIEEYFQVTGFAGHVRPSHWDLYEPRAEQSTERLLEMLAAADVRATFFVLGWLANRCPRLVRRIADAGHEVASHGYWHQLVTTQSLEQFRSDVRAAKAVLEDIVGRPVVGYRAPSFSISPDRAWAFEVLVEEGHEFDSSMQRSSDGRPFVMETPAGPLTEFPLPTVRGIPVGGGGYFRLMPYWLTRRSLRRINADGTPACVYLHPWEIDPDQPRLRAPFVKSWRHRVNLRRTEPRLEQLVRDFRFGTMSAVMGRAETPSRPAMRVAA